MSRSIDLYSILKNISVKYEQNSNEAIKEWINSESFVNVASIVFELINKLTEQIKKDQDIFTIPLNIPTKDDMANASQLVIQTQDKLDQTEEQLWVLTDQVNQIQEQLERHQEFLEKTLSKDGGEQT